MVCVIAYSACGDLGCFTSDLVDSIDAAVADGVDVINYSIGGGASADPIRPTSLFCSHLNANVWVATSGGNSGPGPDTIGGPAHRCRGSPQSVPAPHDRTYTSPTSSRKWPRSPRAVQRDVLRPDGLQAAGRRRSVGQRTLRSGGAVSLRSDVTGKIVICLRGVFARFDKGLAVANAGGAGMILYNPDNAEDTLVHRQPLPAGDPCQRNDRRTAIKAYAAAAGARATASLTDRGRAHERHRVR